MGRKECRYDVYARILKFCDVPQNITSIIELCGLSWKTAQKHIPYLISKGMLRKIEVPKLPKPLFMTTLKGLQYLKYYGKLQRFLENGEV